MNLFIDTAVKGCNIALFNNQGDVIASVQEPIERGHAEAILPLYEDLLSQTNLSSNDVENIYVTVGPGSFTGLRVGLTVARFIAFTLGKPIHGITTFQAFSAGLSQSQKHCILVETRRSDFYAQILEADMAPVTEPQSIEADIIADLLKENDCGLITGDAVNRFGDLQKAFGGVQQDMINIEKVVRAIADKAIKPVKAEAFYIRDADVSKPKAIINQQR